MTEGDFESRFLEMQVEVLTFPLVAPRGIPVGWEYDVLRSYVLDYIDSLGFS